MCLRRKPQRALRPQGSISTVEIGSAPSMPGAALCVTPCDHKLLLLQHKEEAVMLEVLHHILLALFPGS